MGPGYLIPDAQEWGPVVEDLVEFGYAARRDFVPASMVSALRHDLYRCRSGNLFTPAAVGRERVFHAGLRSDVICWFDPTNLTPPQCAYLQWVEQFRLALNRQLQLGVFDFECHYTVYRPGSHYAKHVDQPRGSDARVVSIIVYVNESWRVDDGGVLRLFFPTRTLDVLPEPGTLIAFLSARIEHEVVAPQCDRYSVTGWLRRR